MIPIKPRDNDRGNILSRMWSKMNKKITQTRTESDELRHLTLFQFVDLTKDFYFAYSYEITSTFQHNYICQESSNLNERNQPPTQDAFEWNHYQTESLRSITRKTSFGFWVLPITHGSYCQRSFSFFGKEVTIMLIARRSRHYAGTRYLKRGISVHGKVANDCETEQIVQVDTGLSAQYCSHVQMRGSIPVYWSQETSVTMPKPPININRVDPNYTATQDHFADLLVRYKAPIIVLDLVKQQEKHRRETLVGAEYRQAVSFINLYLPLSQQVRYCALDYDLLKKKARAPKGGEKNANNNAAELAQLSSQMSGTNGDSGMTKTRTTSDMNEFSDTFNSPNGAIRQTQSGTMASSGGGGYAQKAQHRVAGNNNNIPIYNISAIQASLDVPASVIPQVRSTQDLENVLDSYLNTSLSSYSDVLGTYPGVGTGHSGIGTGLYTGISYNSGFNTKSGPRLRSGSTDGTLDYSSGTYYSGNLYGGLQSSDDLYINSTLPLTSTGATLGGSMMNVPLSPAPTSGMNIYTGTPGLGLTTNNYPYGANTIHSNVRAGLASAVSEAKGPKDALQERINEVTDMSICETGIFSTDTTYLQGISELRADQIQEATQRGYMLQTGVMRTNCIDCIDRTNAAQIYMGLKGLHICMQALGLHSPPGSSAANMVNWRGAGDSGGFYSANDPASHIAQDSNSLAGNPGSGGSGGSALDSGNVIIRALIEMYTDMGNKISIQYGGSEAHLKFAGIDTGKSAVGEQFTSVKRYYNNSFLDIAKQHAMNVFLGMYVPVEGGTPLQESEGGDHHLHNKSLRPGEPYTNIFLLHDMRNSVHSLMSTAMYIRNFDSRLATMGSGSAITSVSRMSGIAGDRTDNRDSSNADVGSTQKSRRLRSDSKSKQNNTVATDKSVNARLREICGVTGEWDFQTTPEGTICMLPVKEKNSSGDDSTMSAATAAPNNVAASLGTNFLRKPPLSLENVTTLQHPHSMSIDIMHTLKRFSIDPRKACNTNKNVGKYTGVFSEQVVKKAEHNLHAAYGLPDTSGGNSASNGGNSTSTRTFASKSYSRNSFYNRAAGTKGGKLRLECFAVRISSQKRIKPDSTSFGATDSSSTLSVSTPTTTAADEDEIVTIESADNSLIDPWTGALVEEADVGNGERRNPRRESMGTAASASASASVSASVSATAVSVSSPSQDSEQLARNVSPTTPTTPSAAAYYENGGTAGFSSSSSSSSGSGSVSGAVNGSSSGIVLSAYALQNIIRSQKRRFVNQDMAQRTKNALTMWWRGAIYEHGARTAALKVPPMSTRSRTRLRYLRARLQKYGEKERGNSTSIPAAALGNTGVGPVTGIVSGVMNAHGVGVIDDSNGFSVKQITSPRPADVGMSLDENSPPTTPTASAAATPIAARHNTKVTPSRAATSSSGSASGLASNYATAAALEDRVYQHIHKPSKFTFFDELLPNSNNKEIGINSVLPMAPFLVPEDATLRRAAIAAAGQNPDSWINDQDEINEGLRSAAGLRVRRRLLTTAASTGEYGTVSSRHTNKLIGASAGSTGTLGSTNGSPSGQETPMAAPAPLRYAALSGEANSTTADVDIVGKSTDPLSLTGIDPLSNAGAGMQVQQHLRFSPIKPDDSAPAASTSVSVGTGGRAVAGGAAGIFLGSADANVNEREIIENMAHQIATDEELAAIEKHKTKTLAERRQSVTRRDTIPFATAEDLIAGANTSPITTVSGTAGAASGRDSNSSATSNHSEQSATAVASASHVSLQSSTAVPSNGMTPIPGTLTVLTSVPSAATSGMGIRDFVRGIGHKASSVISVIGKGVGLTSNGSPGNNTNAANADNEHILQLEKDVFSTRSDVGLRTLQGGGWLSPWASTNSPQMAEYNGSAFAHMSSYGNAADALGIRKVQDLIPVVVMHIESTQVDTDRSSIASASRPVPVKQFNRTLPLERLLVCPPLPQSVDVNLGPMQSKKSIASYIQYSKLYEHPELLGGNGLATGALWDMSSSHSKAYQVGVPGTTERADSVFVNTGSAGTKENAPSGSSRTYITNNADLIAQTEFSAYLHDINLDLNDVSGMETLADDYQIFTTLHRGIYTGMNRADSAIGAEYALQASYIRTEDDLLSIGHMENMSEVAAIRDKLSGISNNFRNSNAISADNSKSTIGIGIDDSMVLSVSSKIAQDLITEKSYTFANGIGAGATSVNSVARTLNGTLISEQSPHAGSENLGQAHLAAIRHNYYHTHSQSSAIPSQLYHKLVHTPNSVLSGKYTDTSVVGGAGVDVNTTASLGVQEPVESEGEMKQDSDDGGGGSSSSTPTNTANTSNRSPVKGAGVSVSRDKYWKETLAIAAIQADSLHTNRRMFYSDELNNTVYPNDGSVPYVDNKRTGKSVENGNDSRRRGSCVLLAYAPSWRTRSSIVASNNGLDTYTSSTSPDSHLESPGESELLPPHPPTSRKEAALMTPATTRASASSHASSGTGTGTGPKLASEKSDAAVLTEFDTKIQIQQQKEAAAAGGGGIVSTIANSLKKKEVDVNETYTASNQILTVNNDKLGISVPPISREARSVASPTKRMSVSIPSSVASSPPPDVVVSQYVTASGSAGTTGVFLGSITEGSDAENIMASEQLLQQSLIVKPIGSKIVTLKNYTVKNSNTPENKLLKDITLPAVVQRLSRASKSTKLASGIAVEINAQAKRFVNQYGSYYRYASYDRLSSRLSFLMNDSCLDTYTQCFMYNTHMPISDSSSIETRNQSNFGTGVSANNTYAGSSVFNLFLSQPHLHPNWFIGTCFDEVSFIAVNPSPYDMQAGRARWSGSSLLSTAAIAAPFLCVAKQLKYYLLLRQQQVKTDYPSSRLLSNSYSDNSIGDIHSTKKTKAVTLEVDFDKSSSRDKKTAVRFGTGTATASEAAAAAAGFVNAKSEAHPATTDGDEIASDDDVDDDDNDDDDDENDDDDDENDDDDDDDDDDENELMDVNASKPFFVEGDEMYLGGVAGVEIHNAQGSVRADSLKSIHVQTTTTTTTTTTTSTTTTVISNNGHILGSKSSNRNIVQSSTVNTDTLTWGNRQYNGFIHLSGDMYCKAGEANVLLNEIAVRSLLRCAQNKSRRR